LPSDFENIRTKGKVFSFGISREAYHKVYAKEQPPADLSLPGPGAYDVREVPGRDAKKTSFRPKTTNPSIFSIMQFSIVFLMFPKTPGPGSYDLLPGISPKGQQFLSKFESSRAAAFNPPHSKRFAEIRIFLISVILNSP